MTYRPETGGEFERLLLLLVEEELGAEDLERLGEIFLGDRDAREYYARYVAIHAALEAKQACPPIILPDRGPQEPASGNLAVGGQPSESADDKNGDNGPQSPTANPPLANPALVFLAGVGRRGWGYVAEHTLLFSALAVLVLLAALAVQQAGHLLPSRGAGGAPGEQAAEARAKSPPGTDGDRADGGAVVGDGGRGDGSQKEGIRKKGQPPLAALTNSSAARWAGDPPTAVRSDQLPAVYHLLEGGAEITLANRTVFTLEAPSRLELLGSERALLHEGRVVAYVPNHLVSFLIDTPTIAIQDLGTEFGVGVRPDGETLVQVYAGKVVATAKSAFAGPAARRQLTAGQAVTVGKVTQDIPFVANRFIRWLPAPLRIEDEFTPRNTPKLETLLVPRARKPVRVDGDLSEWDMSHAFEAHCNAPYGDDYHARGAMMYDDKNLYVAAVVADPSPMRSVVDPALDAEHCFSGGGVQIRLLANHDSVWPSDLRTKFSVPGPRGEKLEWALRPQDVDERVLHLTMWYFEPRDQVCLYVQHGMDYHACTVNPLGCQGAFRKLDSGRGYVMEYAVPWKALGIAADPPRRGDVLPATWIVHWSDEGGRSWRGKLVEVHNLSETNRDEFWRAVTWGKAQFLP